MTDLNKFKDNLSRDAFGMTREEALLQGICIQCRLPWRPRTYSTAGIAEYNISGMCEKCFDAMFGEEDNQ